MIYRFSDCRLDTDRFVLTRAGEPCRLEPQVFEVLALLVRNSGRLVTKEELLDEVWGRRHVSDAAITSRIRAARKAVGDDGTRQAVIRTVHGKGYRLVADARLEDGGEDRAVGEPVVPCGPAAMPAGSGLPAPVQRLIGREAVLAELVATLQAHRLVTLIGPGGVGKTSLAYELARQAEPGFPDGVLPVEFVTVSDGDATVRALATALDVQPRQDTSLEDAVLGMLRSRRALLLLDNCEHLVSTLGPMVDRILRAAPGVVMVATSREPLAVAGERLRPVEPLPVPSPGESSPGALRTVPAVALFTERAVAVDPEFGLDDTTSELVGEICRRLDGMPLAIELAAARARTVGVVEIARRLDERFRLQRGVRHGADPPHRALRDAVQWSYDLLDDDQQALFRELSVFAGSFELDDAAAICGPGDELDTLDLMTALAERSMLVSRGPPGAVRRYELLETLRAYGDERLAAGERDGLRVRHSRHYAALSGKVQAGQRGAREPEVTAHADGAFADFRTAQRHALQSGDLDTACELICAIREFAMRSMRYEAFEWAGEALPGATEADHPLAPVLRGIVAYAAWLRGEFDLALALADEAHGARPGCDDPSRGLAQRVQGNVLFVLGEVDRGVEAVRRQLQAAEASGDLSRVVHGRYMLSIACSSTGQRDEALRLARLAHEAAAGSASPTDQASAWAASGFACADDVPAALDAFARSDRLARAAGNRWMSLFARTESSGLALARGDLGAACTGLAEAVDLWHRAGEWSQEWHTLSRCVVALCAIGEDELAARLIGAIERRATMGTPPVIEALRERALAAGAQLRSRLGAEHFLALHREGAALPVADVVYRTRAALLGH